jgi:hypothetical protein
VVSSRRSHSFAIRHARITVSADTWGIRRFLDGEASEVAWTVAVVRSRGFFRSSRIER